MALLLASPATALDRLAIMSGEVWHFSKATPRQLMTSPLNGLPGAPNATIRLSPPSGWQLDFWKFIRDLSLWDPKAMVGVDRARYLYCFLGQPGSWQKATNVQKAPLTVRIPGQALLAAVAPAHLFYRSLDRVLVVRGDYAGPAILDPTP